MKRPLPYLAEAAARERDSRKTNYPKLVEAGKIEKGEAEADLRCWRAIATLFAEGSVEVEAVVSAEGAFQWFSPSWAELEHAASKALIHLSAKAREHREPGPGVEGRQRDLIARRDAVQSIHDRIVWSRWFWTDLTSAHPEQGPSGSSGPCRRAGLEQQARRAA